MQIEGRGREEKTMTFLPDEQQQLSQVISPVTFMQKHNTIHQQTHMCSMCNIYLFSIYLWAHYFHLYIC